MKLRQAEERRMLHLGVTIGTDCVWRSLCVELGMSRPAVLSLALSALGKSQGITRAQAIAEYGAELGYLDAIEPEPELRTGDSRLPNPYDEMARSVAAKEKAKAAAEEREEDDDGDEEEAGYGLMASFSGTEGGEVWTGETKTPE